MNTIAVCDIGRMRYAEAWELQKKLFGFRHFGLIGDMLLYTEHEHVYTIGKGGDENHLLANETELAAAGVDVFRVDRGGDITYHGPGQMVAYPIMDLTQFKSDLHWYLRGLEQVVILALEEFGVEGEREEGMTGVWVKGEKIAAVGVKVSRWVTMHGFALNVTTDLTRFGRIIPCGIFHKGVTSLEKVLGRTVSLAEVQVLITAAFGNVFGRRMVTVDRQSLRQFVAERELEQA